MSITATKNARGDTVVKAGKHTLACITAETDPQAVEAFIALCVENNAELTALGIEYEERRNWNFSHSGKGKNWPIFNRREKRIRQLCKMAGIIDS